MRHFYINAIVSILGETNVMILADKREGEKKKSHSLNQKFYQYKKSAQTRLRQTTFKQFQLLFSTIVKG